MDFKTLFTIVSITFTAFHALESGITFKNEEFFWRGAKITEIQTLPKTEKNEKTYIVTFESGATLCVQEKNCLLIKSGQKITIPNSLNLFKDFEDISEPKVTAQ